jgi:hypothetical protein
MVAWQQAGVWERLHTLLLADLRAAGVGGPVGVVERGRES